MIHARLKSHLLFPFLGALIVALGVPGAAASAQSAADCTPVTVQRGQHLVIPIQVIGKGTTDIIPLKTGDFAFDPKLIAVSPKATFGANYGEVHVRGKKVGNTPLFIDLPDLGFGLLYDVTVIDDLDKELDKALKEALKALKGDTNTIVKAATTALKEHTTAVKKAGAGFDMLATVKAAQDDRLGGMHDAGDAAEARLEQALAAAIALLEANGVPDSDKGPGFSRGACDSWDDFAHDVTDLVDGSADKIGKSWKKFQSAVNKSGTHGLSSAGHFHFDGGMFPGPTGTDAEEFAALSEQAQDALMASLFTSNLVPLPTAGGDEDGEGGGIWHSIAGGVLPNSGGEVFVRRTLIDGSSTQKSVPTDAGDRWSDCDSAAAALEARNFLELTREALETIAAQTAFCDPITDSDGTVFEDLVDVGLPDD